jgi:hypothetical protein
MATRRYGISIGEGEFSITEAAGAAVSSDKVELTVELATTAVNWRGSTRGVEKQEVIDAIDKIKNHIIKGNWPPA